MTTDFYKAKLNQVALSAQTVDDIIPILKWISIDKFPKFIKKSLNEMDTSLLKRIHFNSSSINEIIPEAIIQHILSFQPLLSNQANCVNKQWNKLSQQNEKNYYSKLLKSLDENSPIPYNSETNSTWIMYPKYPVRGLSKIETDLGFKGPITHFNRAPTKPGDRILVHAAKYQLVDLAHLHKSLSIVGLENNATITGCDQFCKMDAMPGRSPTCVHIENITFDCNKDAEGPFPTMEIPKNCKVWLKECIIKCGYLGINVGHGAFLNADNCIFTDGSTGIKLYPISDKVIIRNCVFKNLGKDGFLPSAETGCIKIVVWPGYDSDDRSLVELVCDGNIFENNLCYPITEREKRHILRRGEYLDKLALYANRTDLYQLRNNILKGYNFCCRKVDGANKIYYNDEPYICMAQYNAARRGIRL